MRLMVKKQFIGCLILLLILCSFYPFLTRIYGQSNHQTKATLQSDGGSYTLSHILGHYNVFTSEDYYGTHVVGPMIVGGKTGRTTLDGGQGSLSVGGISHTTGSVKEFKHDVPSYFKKKAMIAGNTVITGSDVPLYLGLENQNQQNWALQGPHQSVYDDYYFTDNYVDFNVAFQQLKQDALTYQNFSGENQQGKMIHKIDLPQSLIQQIKNELVKNKDYIYENEYYKIFKNDLNKLEKDGLTIQLKLGENYHFSSLDDFDCIIYDYEDYQDDTTTMISSDDEKIKSFPKILKTKNDAMGNVPGGTCLINQRYQNAYQFNTLESGYHCAVMYLCLKANEIRIPGGQGKLNGHLVALDARVNIYSGDYNGTIIAKSVNSKAEGHMWCYHGMTTPGTLDINLSKYVNLKTPDQQFTFELSCLKGPLDSSIYKSLLKQPLKTSNQNQGLIHYRLTGFNQAGEYIFKVRELDSQGYKCSPEAIYIKVKATLNQQSIVPVIVDYYSDETCLQKLEKPSFNNSNTTSLKIKKIWQDDKSQTINSPVSQINVDLYQQAYLKKGYEIKVKVLLKQNNTLSSIKEEKVFVSEKGKLTFKVEGDTRYQNLYVTGIEKINCNQGIVKEISSDHHQWNSQYDARKLIEVSQIHGDDTVEIIYIPTAGMNVSAKPEDFHLTIQSYDQGTYQKNGLAKKISTIQLEQSQQWFKEVSDLISQNGNLVYRYYVQESTLPGYQVTYQLENKSSCQASDIETSGLQTINIINQKERNRYLSIQKVDKDHHQQCLQDARFSLYDQNHQLILFKENQGVYVRDQRGSGILTTNKKGIIKIDLNSLKSLNIKNYVLKEIKAPDGYSQSFKEVKLYFDENKTCYYQVDNHEKKSFNDHENHTIVLENQRAQIQIPDTGYEGFHFEKAGIYLLLSALTLEMMKQIKRRKKTKC